MVMIIYGFCLMVGLIVDRLISFRNKHRRRPTLLLFTKNGWEYNSRIRTTVEVGTLSVKKVDVLVDSIFKGCVIRRTYLIRTRGRGLWCRSHKPFCSSWRPLVSTTATAATVDTIAVTGTGLGWFGSSKHGRGEVGESDTGSGGDCCCTTVAY